MIPITAAYNTARRSRFGEPVILLRLITGHGTYLFAARGITDEMRAFAGPIRADGSWQADGTLWGTGEALVGEGDLVANFGSLLESLTSPGEGLLHGLEGTEPPEMTVTLSERDLFLARLEARGGLLGAAADIMLGWPGLTRGDYITRFTGEVSAVDSGSEGWNLTLSATRPGDIDLEDDFELPSAGDYANPRNGDDRLPLVWGEMITGGEGGQWEARCIDTVNRVYALAGSAIQGVSGGNAVTLYNRDKEQIGSGFIFNEADDYESTGREIATAAFPEIIATDIAFAAAGNLITGASTTFPACANWMATIAGSANNDGEYKIIDSSAHQLTLDPEGSALTDEAAGASVTITFDQERNEPLTVRASGRVDDDGDLIENPVDIALDILELAGWEDRYLDTTGLARARALCAGQGYRAAGVIPEETGLGELLSAILPSFRVNWWPDQAGRITARVELPTSSIRESDCCAVFNTHQTGEATVTRRLSDICNQCKASYAYNWATGEYGAEDDGADSVDALSVSLHGARSENFEWAWVRSETVRQTLQELTVALYGSPTRDISLPLDSLEEAPLQKGDSVYFCHAALLDENDLPLMNQIGRVLENEMEMDGKTMTLRLGDTGAYKTLKIQADGSWQPDGSIYGGLRDRAEM